MSIGEKTMMNLFVSLSLFLIVGHISINAQTFLSYDTHGYISDANNEIHLTDPIEPGEHGFSAIWDFSTLIIDQDFVGSFKEVEFDKDMPLFSEKVNVIIEEFGNKFYFKSDNISTEQFGYVTKDGNAIKYTKPYVKMIYPFAFGDSFSGDFEATLIINKEEAGDISGTYDVVADGQGELILPGGIIYDDALRIKEVKTSQQLINGQQINVQHIAYRWFVKYHRFPVLTSINSTWTYPDGSKKTYSLAGYNPVILHHATDIIEKPGMPIQYSVYPNPYSEFISIRLYVDEPSDVSIEIFDQNGKLVKGLEKANAFQGELLHRFSAKNLGLGTGIYFVRFIVNGKAKSIKILEI